MLKEVFMVPRDLVTRNCLVATELAVYLAVMDLTGFYEREIMVHDEDVIFNMTGEIRATSAQRKMVNEAIASLIRKKALSGQKVGQGRYLVQCKEMGEVKYGYVMIDYGKIRTLIRGCADGREWQGLLLYYFELMCHMDKEGTCRYSLQYFSDHTGISELTLSKYNSKLTDLGLIKIQHHSKSTNSYLTL